MPAQQTDRSALFPFCMLYFRFKYRTTIYPFFVCFVVGLFCSISKHIFYVPHFCFIYFSFSFIHFDSSRALDSLVHHVNEVAPRYPAQYLDNVMPLITIIYYIGHAPRAHPIYANIIQQRNHLARVPSLMILVEGKWRFSKLYFDKFIVGRACSVRVEYTFTCTQIVHFHQQLISFWLF